jgi:hypothetical protein
MPNLIHKAFEVVQRHLKPNLEPSESATGSPDFTTTEYIYQPLSDSCRIRLLKIHGGNGPIHCSLAETSKQWPSYTALSYTWGDPVQHGRTDSIEERFIYCGNKRLRVTQNLLDFLEQARADGQRQRFWVDAICINQKNLDERSTQVGMMGEIYSKANNVIIWLGKADSDTEDAVSLITTFAMSVKWETQQLAWSDWGNFSFNDPEFYTKAGLKPFELSDWEKIIRVLSRTWFSRLWILQEIVLSKEKIVVIGSFVLKYAFIEFLVMFLNQSRWGTFLEQFYYHSNTKKEKGTLGTWLLNLAALLTPGKRVAQNMFITEIPI